MAERKMIVTQSQITAETKKMVVEIKDLMKMIDDEETKRKKIIQEFTLFGVRLSIEVHPEVGNTNHIRVGVREVFI